MAFVDRVLTLKLATDVGDINAKMTSTGSSMGRLAGQVAGFAKATAIGLALEGIDQAIGRFGKGIEDARAYRNTLAGLNLVLGNIGVTGGEAADVVDRINARSLDLGFDDVETLSAFQDLVNLTGDADAALVVLEATFDRSRAEGKELNTALEETVRLFRGGTRQMDLFGIKADEIPDGLSAVDEGLWLVNEALGQYDTAAEDFATSTDGMLERVGTMSDRLFATLGEEVLKLGDQLLPVLVDDVLPALGEAFATVQPFLQDAAAAVGELFGAFAELWDSLEPAREALAPIVEILGSAWVLALETITELIRGLAQVFSGDFTGALDTFRQAAAGLFDPIIDAVRGGLNTIIDLWNSLALPGFSIDLPKIEVGPVTVFDGGAFQLWPSVGLPNIPRLASGGIVTAPTLALIGESGPEAVVPLDRGGGMTGGDVIVNITGDPRVVEAAVVSALRRVGRGSVRVDPFRPGLGAR